MADLQIASESLGLATGGGRIESATYVESNDAGLITKPYCAVQGVIYPVDNKAPKIEFQTNLPKAWRGRVLHYGGGGNNGKLITGLEPYKGQDLSTPHPLDQGFITAGSDSGHQGAHLFDFSFALNDEAFRNYAYLAIKKVHDATEVVAKRAYGEKPERFYFIGISKGGQEALAAATQYPGDYDGVLAIAPAHNMIRLTLDFLAFGQSIYADDAAGWLDGPRRELLTDSAYEVCDALDGLEDQIIANFSACKEVFTIEYLRQNLRCDDGEDAGKDCFSDGQLDFIAQKSVPTDLGFSVAGQRLSAPWPLLEGSDFLMKGWLPAFGYSPHYLPRHVPLYLVGSGNIRYFVLRDPDFEVSAFDPALHREQLQETAAKIDLTLANLGPFFEGGGKALLLHGALDSNISHYNSSEYYLRQVERFGQERLDQSMRFYVVPGWDHGFGRYDMGIDGLGLLVDWVEGGSAPVVIPSVDNNDSARRRPLCPWPMYAHHVAGLSGSSGVGTFECRES